VRPSGARANQLRESRDSSRLSPGTFYPMPHSLERKGYLTSRREGTGKRSRRFYSITPKGRDALIDAKEKVKELFGELFEARQGPQRS